MQVFLGSTNQSLNHLDDIASVIKNAGHTPQPWTEVFRAGDQTLQRLIALCDEVDAAAFVFGDDDRVVRQGSEKTQTGANVLIEYGLFARALGPNRVAICRFGSSAIASDIAGITYIDWTNQYDARLRLKAWLSEIARGTRQRSAVILRKDVGYLVNRIIERALESKQELLVAGIANTDFFGPAGDETNTAFRNALKEGLHSRFLFLDPTSIATVRRGVFESPRLETKGVIGSCIRTATGICNEFPKQMQVRVCEEMPCFICCNDEEGLLHIYLNSATGAQMPVTVVYGRELAQVRHHFENLWGERWVLFDLGIVLVNFSHKRVSSALAKLLPEPERYPNDIYKFIFESTEGPSRNTRVDRGDKDLDWLQTELAREFGISIGSEDMRSIWCSIFDDIDAQAVACVERVKAQGIKVAICSNTNSHHWDHLSKQSPRLIHLFDEQFLSYKMRCVKTDTKFFDQVVKVTKQPPEHHLFVDDLEANLKSASTLGISTLKAQGIILFEDIEDFIIQHHWI